MIYEPLAPIIILAFFAIVGWGLLYYHMSKRY